MDKRTIINCQSWKDGTVSNYIVTPLCNNCQYFSADGTSNLGRFSCKAGTTASSANIAGSNKEKGLTFDDCKVFKPRENPDSSKSKTNTNKGLSKLGILVLIIAIPIAAISAIVGNFRRGDFSIIWIAVLAAYIFGVSYAIKYDGNKNKYKKILLLVLFFGMFGIHRFYVKKTRTGIIMILLCWTGISLIWAIIDFIIILSGHFKDKQGNIIK